MAYWFQEPEQVFKCIFNCGIVSTMLKLNKAKPKHHAALHHHIILSQRICKVDPEINYLLHMVQYFMLKINVYST